MQARQTIKPTTIWKGETALRHPCLAGEDVEAGLPIHPLFNSFIHIGSQSGLKLKQSKEALHGVSIRLSAEPPSCRTSKLCEKTDLPLIPHLEASAGVRAAS